MNPDFKERLQLFNANHVEYLIVGGYAVIEYTDPHLLGEVLRTCKSITPCFLSEGPGTHWVAAGAKAKGLPVADTADQGS